MINNSVYTSYKKKKGVAAFLIGFLEFLKMLIISAKKFEYSEPTPSAPITCLVNCLVEVSPRKREKNSML